MKKILYAGISILALIWGCSKESGIDPELTPDRLYEIQDNPSDSIQHRTFEIYRTYGVPVYFNDTIGRTFVKTDIKGDSVFQYEVMDPAWGFTGNSGLEYRYTYMTDPVQQMRFLDMLENFLSTSSPKLHPYSVLVVDSYKTIGYRDAEENYGKGHFQLFYKLLLVTGNERTSLDGKPDEILRKTIEVRITDYIDLLAAFNRISEPYIGKRDWTKLGIKELTYPIECVYSPEWYPGYHEDIRIETLQDNPLQGVVRCLRDDWPDAGDYTPEAVAEMRRSVRYEIGRYGFVEARDDWGMEPPQSEEEDLKIFVKEVMSLTKEEFAARWKDSPLVMQKYAIVADIIENKLGVKL